MTMLTTYTILNSIMFFIFKKGESNIIENYNMKMIIIWSDAYYIIKIQYYNITGSTGSVFPLAV